MRVGFVGLGNQGGPMAIRIARSGYSLSVWARRPEVLEPYVAEGAVAVPTLAELGASSDLVAVCVTTDADVRTVILEPTGLLPSMRPGSSLAVHSTVHPDLVREIADAARDRTVSVVDAPVSGGNLAATAGTLAVLAGGDEQVIEQWRPVFATYASTVEMMGGVGAGQLAKLVNNALSAANLGASLRAVAAAEELGLDRDAIIRVLQASSGDSFMVRMVPLMTPDGMQLGAERYRKDVDLFRDVSLDTTNGVALGAISEVAVQLIESIATRAQSPSTG